MHIVIKEFPRIWHRDGRGGERAGPATLTPSSLQGKCNLGAKDATEARSEKLSCGVEFWESSGSPRMECSGGQCFSHYGPRPVFGEEGGSSEGIAGSKARHCFEKTFPLTYIVYMRPGSRCKMYILPWVTFEKSLSPTPPIATGCLSGWFSLLGFSQLPQGKRRLFSSEVDLEPKHKPANNQTNSHQDLCVHTNTVGWRSFKSF